MKKVCKIRCYPNKYQENKINQILGACRFIMNKYIEYNQNAYKEDKKFITAYDFSKIINKLKKYDSDYEWLDDISSKAISNALITQEKAFKNFFRKIKRNEKTSYPKFKSRKKMRKESFFFIKDNIHFNTGKKNIIQIPILKYIRITERNYLPNNESITSGRLIREDDKYYLMFIYDVKRKHQIPLIKGLGIDLGIKNYMSLSTETNSMSIKHFKDYDNYKKVSEKITYIQRLISKKQEINYWRLLNLYMDKHKGEEPNETSKNIMKGESYNTSQIKKLQKKLRRLYKYKTNIRKDFIQKSVYEIVVRVKPKYITIEDLSISNMISTIEEGNHDLHRYISESGFYYFRECLTNKTHEYHTELRIANKYFASSKTCSDCGCKVKHLTLNDRIFICPECGLKIDRDTNASINLLNTKKYSIA